MAPAQTTSKTNGQTARRILDSWHPLREWVSLTKQISAVFAIRLTYFERLSNVQLWLKKFLPIRLILFKYLPFFSSSKERVIAQSGRNS